VWLVWLLVSRPSICVCWTKPLGPLPPRRRMVCVVLLPVCVQQVHVVASIGGVERHQLIVVPGVIAYSGRAPRLRLHPLGFRHRFWHHRLRPPRHRHHPLPPRRRMARVVPLPVCVQQVNVVASVGGVERHQLIRVPGVIAYSGRVPRLRLHPLRFRHRFWHYCLRPPRHRHHPLPPRRRMARVVPLPVCVQQVNVVASMGGVERHQLIVVLGVIAYSGRVTESVILTRFPQVWISMSVISQVSLP